MASYAELLQTCTEFQENFSTLNGKYNALALELKSVKALCDRQQQELVEGESRRAALQQRLSETAGELEEAKTYSERYQAAMLTMGQLKDQLTSSRQGSSDVTTEHTQEVAQLKEQLTDMARRVDAAASGPRMREAQKQVQELEARCVAVEAQLLEARERHGQQLLTAHDALREQQSRTLELEQRYRSVEAEVSEMRALVRRSTELQNDAAVLKERYASAAAVAQQQAADLRTEVDAHRRRLGQLKSEQQAELDQDRQEAREQRHLLEERVATLTGELATAQAAADAAKALARSAEADTDAQVQHAREVAVAEISALRRAQAVAKEESVRLTWRAEKAEAEVRAKEEVITTTQERQNCLRATITDLKAQLDAAAQGEAWVVAEKHHLAEELTTANRTIETLTQSLQQHEETMLEVERLTLQLHVTAAEAEQAQLDAQHAAAHAKDIEAAAALQMKDLRKTLKATTKQCASEAARADRLRRQLMTALVEKEAELCEVERMASRRVTVAALEEGPRKSLALSQHNGTAGIGGAAMGGYDVLSVLRSQTQQTEALHSRLVQLAR